MEFDEVRKLVELVDSSGIHELEIEHKGVHIRIAKAPPAPVSQVVAPAQPTAAVPVTAPATEDQPAAEASTVDERYHQVKAPMVGTFYRAPSPELPPFIEVGAEVKAGQTLCIVEAMKTMNEIEAEVSGTIVEIVADNEQPLEFDQVMILIDPKE